MLKLTNLAADFNISYRGAIAEKTRRPTVSKVPGFDSRCRKFFFLFFFVLLVFFFFRKIYVHFLTDLKYTGRLIADSLSAFISKIH